MRFLQFEPEHHYYISGVGILLFLSIELVLLVSGFEAEPKVALTVFSVYNKHGIFLNSIISLYKIYSIQF